MYLFPNSNSNQTEDESTEGKYSNVNTGTLIDYSLVMLNTGLPWLPGDVNNWHERIQR